LNYAPRYLAGFKRAAVREKGKGDERGRKGRR